MPELPEVETMVRDLALRVPGRAITGVVAAFPGEVIYPEYPQFVERITGQTIASLSRRGKYAIFALDSGDLLIVHRGMSGSLLLRPGDSPMEPYVRIVLELDDGRQLRLDDPRKFGKVYLIDPSNADRSLPWERMGPEPMNGAFTSRILRERLSGRRASIKSLLLDQHIVAGLGNIYVDEALHEARIHPERRANTLSPAEIKRLHVAIQRVLAAAIEGRGTTFRTYSDIEGRAGQYQSALQVFGKTGWPCRRCGATIVKLVVGGRGTHICPHCQRV